MDSVMNYHFFENEIRLLSYSIRRFKGNGVVTVISIYRN